MSSLKFDMEVMEKRCLAPIDDFLSLGTVSGTKPGERTVFIDRGAKVLGVAHLDTVNQGDVDHFQWFYIKRQLHVFNGQLDDRLGAYIIHDLLPEMGVKCDVLFTEGEEIGRSTAELFIAEKQYNWMFSFDRTGFDAVMYQYWTSQHADMLRSYGWKVEKGSFSDIVYLDHLGCAGFNFGTGYYDYHSELSHANLDDTATSLSWFLRFWKEKNGTHMPFDPKSAATGYAHSWDAETRGQPHYGGHEWYQQGELEPRRPGKSLNELKSQLARLETRKEAQEEIDAEEAARLEAALEGVDMDELIDCPFCRHSVVSTNFSFRYDMCSYCVDEMELQGKQAAYDLKRQVDEDVEGEFAASTYGG